MTSVKRRGNDIQSCLRSTERAGLTSELDIGEQDVDVDGDDDHGNNIGESDMVEGDEVSAAHSCKSKASCIRMFDSDDVKDHSVKVQVLEKGKKHVHNGTFAEDWG